MNTFSFFRLSTDSVAQHNTIGIDLVAMSVNDILVCGAEPLFFLDYYATGKLQVPPQLLFVQGLGTSYLLLAIHPCITFLHLYPRRRFQRHHRLLLGLQTVACSLVVDLLVLFVEYLIYTFVRLYRQNIVLHLYKYINSGGETAEMAGMYGPGEYDLAGFAVGAVQKGNILPQ